MQYRINGVILPEGVSLFSAGGGLSPRFASKIDLITGALPAEYGLRTSGIVDIQTKNGAFDQGGYVGMYGGSFSWLQPSFEYGGSQGRLNYYGTGSYLQNSIGISPATPNGPIHDDTKQGFGFGYLEYVLNPTSKVSAIFGTFVGHFQIPNAPGATPAFTVNGISDFDSTQVNENQLEQNYYGVLSYLRAEQNFTFRISTFLRYSNLRFSPDPLADIMFNGIAQQYFRSNTAGGLQAEGSYKITDTNTVRAGLIISAEGTGLQTTSSVLPTEDGVQSSDTPFSIFQSTPKIGSTYSVYAQDEWRILPSLTINGGLRFDAYLAYRDEWQISPRLAATWTPTSTTTVHAGYARYFTPPPLIFTPTSTFARFADTSAAPEVTKNATIKAERAYYLDAGVIQQILPGWKVGVDGYYKWVTNLLDDGQFGAPIVLTPFNYKQGYNWGVEITTSLNLGGFTAYGNLALAQQQAKRIETAQSLFSQDDLELHLQPLHPHRPQPVPHRVGGRLVSVEAHAVQRRHAGGERAADHRQHAQRLDGAGLSAGQPRHHPGLHAGAARGLRGALRHHQRGQQELRDPQRRRDRRLRRAVRAAAGLLRRAEEGVLSARADVGKELRSWNISTASSRSSAWAARRSIRCSSSRSSPRW